MATTRRVPVTLELDLAAYVKGSAEAATVTRRVRETIEELGDEADDASADLSQMASNAVVAARRVDDLGDEALGTAAELAVLKAEMGAVGRAAKDLDIGLDIDLGGVNAAGAAAAGAQVGGGLASGVSSALGAIPGRLRGALIIALIGGVTAASPAIGGILAGAVTGAVGLGGIAGGIASASRDIRVRAAARQFSDEIAAEFFGGGGPFVQPTIDALDELADAFRDMSLGDTFALMAPHVITVARAVGDLGRNAMPGLERAMARAGPFMDVLVEGLGEMGDALSVFLDELSSSEGAVDGLETGLSIINGTIILTGKLLNVLADEYHRWLQQMAFITGLLEDLPGVPDAVTDGWAVLNDIFEDQLIHTPSVHSFGEAADFASRAVGRLATALSDTHDAFLEWKGAEIDAEDALDDLAEALDDSNGSLNVHTEKGRNAREMLLRFAKASAEAAKAKFEEAGNVDKASKVYEQYRRDLIKTLIEAGKTRKEAERLADAWLGVPEKVETDVITRYREFRYPTKVLQDKARAAGGRVSRGETYTVNEQQLEGFGPLSTFTPPFDGFVMPLTATPLAGVGGGGGGGTRVENLTVQAWSDRFSLPQIERELAMHGAH